MHEKIKIKGVLRIYRLDPAIDHVLSPKDMDVALKRGWARLTLCQNNLVVNTGLSVFSRMLGGNAGSPQIDGSGFADINDLTITTMQLGTAVNPPAPDPTDNAPAFTPVVYTPVLVVTYPDDYTVQFGGLVPPTEGNGLLFTQEALLMKNGLLFAKIAYDPQAKNGTYGLQFVHSFAFGLP